MACKFEVSDVQRLQEWRFRLARLDFYESVLIDLLLFQDLREVCDFLLALLLLIWQPGLTYRGYWMLFVVLGLKSTSLLRNLGWFCYSFEARY